MSDYKNDEKSPKDESFTVPLREEKVKIEKQNKVIEEIHINKKKVQETKTIQVPIKREELVVKSRPLLKNADGEEVWGEEETTIIPLKEEKVEVTIESVHTEDVHIHKNKKQTIENQKEQIKKEELNIDKNPSPDLEE